MKNKITNTFLPISISLEKIRNNRNISIPIKLMIGQRYFECNISFVIQNYMLVVAILFLGAIALYGNWGDKQNTYIKNLWVQIGQETPFEMWEIEEPLTAYANTAHTFPLFGDSEDEDLPTNQLMKLASSSSSLGNENFNTIKNDTKNGLPIFVHSVADYDNLAGLAKSENMMEEFMIQKQIRITKSLIKNKSSRLDQLPDTSLLMMNRDIS